MRFGAVIFSLFVICVVCDPTRASPSRVRRQGWNWGGEDDDARPASSTPPSRPTTAPTRPSTAPPSEQPAVSTEVNATQFAACTARCQVTQEYNPVCGTNRVTYENIGKLNCARRCGVAVERSFTGTCSPVPPS